MSRKKILASGLEPVVGHWEEQPSPSMLEELLKKLREEAYVTAHRPSNALEWAEAVQGINVIIDTVKIDENFLENASALEMIQNIGIGYDKVDVDACTERGIIVCNVAEIYSEAVAQHAWALILDVTKQVTRADRSMRAGTWMSKDWMGFHLWGKTLGVIGLGNIGGRVALKGRLAFGMRVLAYDPYLLPEHQNLYGAKLVDLNRLLKESDVVLLSVPLTNETRHMIGEEQLTLMKKSAFLINVCRGPVIDEEALIKRLNAMGIKGAGLDVFEIEPLPMSSPLLAMENVVVTPHIASSTNEAVDKTFLGAVSNVIRYLRGLEPFWIVNPEAYRG